MDDPLAHFIKKEIQSSVEIKHQLSEDAETLAQIGRVARLLVDAFQNGKKLLLAGNGGSAADAQHLAAEFVGRYNRDRDGLPCFALTTDTSILTAVANDLSYGEVFSRQVATVGNEGDVFIGISTSGNSPNILEALGTARVKKISTVGLTGLAGGKIEELCDICIRVPARNTARIQEAHILIGHIICSIVEESIFGEGV